MVPSPLDPLLEAVVQYSLNGTNVVVSQHLNFGTCTHKTKQQQQLQRTKRIGTNRVPTFPD